MNNKVYEKKTGDIIGVLILIFLFTLGNMSNDLKSLGIESVTTEFGVALIAFVAGTFIMMFVPAIYKFNAGGRIECNKGIKICKWNSIILFIISLFTYLIYGIGIVGGIGAILYYYINKWLFVDYNNVNNAININPTILNNNINQANLFNTNNSTVKQVNLLNTNNNIVKQTNLLNTSNTQMLKKISFDDTVTICKYCKMPINKNYNVCPHCRKKQEYNDADIIAIVCIIIIAALFLTLFFI